MTFLWAFEVHFKYESEAEKEKEIFVNILFGWKNEKVVLSQDRKLLILNEFKRALLKLQILS